MKIILIEDSNLDAQAFTSAFNDPRKLSTITHFSNAEDALNRLSEDPSTFDVVVSDYNLPTMSGLELHSAIIERKIELPFVLLTGQGAEKLAVRAIRAGVQEYLPKDLEGEYLLILPELLAKAVGSYKERLKQVEVEQQQRLAAAVFNSTLDAIVVADREKIITHINPAFANATGFNEGTICGLRLSVLVADRDFQIIDEEIWQAVEKEGKWQGEMWIRCVDERVMPTWFSASRLKDKHGNVTNYIVVFSNISKLVEAEEAIRHRANYDALTELPNRTLYYDRLKQSIPRAIRESDILAVMLIDLDHFKAINDSYGHLAGDFVLSTAAARMLSCVRVSDTVARLAGDEFTVTLTKIAHADDAAKIAQKLLAALTWADENQQQKRKYQAPNNTPFCSG